MNATTTAPDVAQTVIDYLDVVLPEGWSFDQLGHGRATFAHESERLAIEVGFSLSGAYVDITEYEGATEDDLFGIRSETATTRLTGMSAEQISLKADAILALVG